MELFSTAAEFCPKSFPDEPSKQHDQQQHGGRCRVRLTHGALCKARRMFMVHVFVFITLWSLIYRLTYVRPRQLQRFKGLWCMRTKNETSIGAAAQDVIAAHQIGFNATLDTQSSSSSSSTTTASKLVNQFNSSSNNNNLMIPITAANSPYELANPTKALPKWARKPPDVFRNNPIIPADKRGCFVHIGKTGGSTLGCSLGFQLHCGKSDSNNNNTQQWQYPVAGGLLPTYTTNVFHTTINDCPTTTTTTMGPAFYLFSIRDPLERVMSAYIYERGGRRAERWGGNALYVDCGFGTLNELAEKGLAAAAAAAAVDDGDDHDSDDDNDGKDSNEPCQKRAYMAIRGQGEYGLHTRFNYQYYTEGTIGSITTTATKAASSPQSTGSVSLESETLPKVLVIRINHAQQDWQSAEGAIGGDPDQPVQFPIINVGNHTRDKTDRYLSPTAKRLLCEGLCEEIQIYKDLLYRAVNLTPEQVQESIDELAVNCPLEAVATSCPT